MINPIDFFNSLIHNEVDFFCGVPDSLLKHLCACIEDKSSPGMHVICANEGNAVAMACGRQIASGKLPVVYMQNSGLGNAINPLVSLADPEVYAIPLLLIIGWRGEPGIHDEPQHKKQGSISEALLETLNIPFSIMDKDSDYLAILSDMIGKAKAHSRPVAILVKKGSFLDYEKETSDSFLPLLREEALDIILQYMGDSLIVSTTGKCSRELYELREKRGEMQRDFLTVGSMGHSSSIATGVALAQTDKRVLCIDGDGAMIMHMGAMALVGNLAPKNLIHIVINNYCHESVGGQKTSANAIAFKELAAALSYKHFYQAQTANKLTESLKECRSLEGPILLEIQVRQGSRKDLGRPKSSPKENKEAFIDAMDIGKNAMGN